jgi:diguanylate cyclase (GGDEF)-like protein
MFTPARKSMPAIDYVSIVRSVYKDRRGMIFGTMASAIGATACAVKTNSLVLYAIAALLILVGVLRYINMMEFEKANIAIDDVDGASYWESRATVIGALVALVFGLWVFCSYMFVSEPVVELISTVTIMAAMVGIVTRNFGLDRLLTAQLAIAVVLISAGLVLQGGVYHWILAAMLVPMLLAYRTLAADVRNVLLSAVHGRVEASRLAGELDAALDTMQHALCMLDEAGNIAVVNDRALATFAELAPGEWVGRPFGDLLAAMAASGKVPASAADEISRAIERQESGKVQMLLGADRYVEVTVSTRQNRTVLLLEDITERIKAAERVTFMARYDALTNLPNRGYFTEQVEADLQRWRNSKTKDMATLLIIDLDDFKHVNDTQGHLVGDRLLVEAASRLRQVLGHRSILARLGGDEFIAYRGGATSAEQVMNDAQAVLAAFRAPFELQGEQLAIGVSVGAVSSEHREDDLSVLMTKADLALYKSKAQGKAQTQTFHDDMDVEYRYRQRLKHELREAINQGNLTLAYQPVIDLKTRRVVGCEALARWHHPELGTIPPSVFIPIAEESGLVSEISRWVLMTATAECHNWPDEVRVAVNISAKDLRSGDVAQMVGMALANSGLAADRLEVEVTETAVIEEREAAAMIFQTLAAQGVGIALDDFGTGYSSLSYLQALPFTKLKIDRSFVIDIANNPRSLKLLTNVARLGRDIGLTVTAEGVETEEQLALILANTDIDQIQGYLFGVPLPRRDIFELIVRMSKAANAAATGAPAEAMRKRG